MRPIWLSLLPVALLAGSALAQPSGTRASPPEAVTQSEGAVVLIRALDPSGGSVVGCGFFVGSDGFILTTHHLTRWAHSIWVKTVRGVALKAVPVASIDESDLELLKVPGQGFPVLSPGNTAALQPGTPLEVLEYGPAAGATQSFETTSVSQIGTGRRLFTISGLPSAPPDGCPVVDSSGSAVGIIGAHVAEAPDYHTILSINEARPLLTKTSPVNNVVSYLSTVDPQKLRDSPLEVDGRLWAVWSRSEKKAHVRGFLSGFEAALLYAILNADRGPQLDLTSKLVSAWEPGHDVDAYVDGLDAFYQDPTQRDTIIPLALFTVKLQLDSASTAPAAQTAAKAGDPHG